MIDCCASVFQAFPRFPVSPWNRFVCGSSYSYFSLSSLFTLLCSLGWHDVLTSARFLLPSYGSPPQLPLLIHLIASLKGCGLITSDHLRALVADINIQMSQLFVDALRNNWLIFHLSLLLRDSGSLIFSHRHLPQKCMLCWCTFQPVKHPPLVRGVYAHPFCHLSVQ